ncbi:hypothetical protein SAMN06265222_11887 [Neorhodopirellula lusitana]|uniref:Uncharacterized protein n=1 Tax=Neorhodopirellula lusitana TaxID=445327 RepID=A0ABY1QQN1_9BACT|nr:hypothetical protein SAMN06265222_11887 [Neorhodopirellula lusitana]
MRCRRMRLQFSRVVKFSNVVDRIDVANVRPLGPARRIKVVIDKSQPNGINPVKPRITDVATGGNNAESESEPQCGKKHD